MCRQYMEPINNFEMSRNVNYKIIVSNYSFLMLKYYSINNDFINIGTNNNLL